MASQGEESDLEESSYSLSDNENLVPSKKKKRGRLYFLAVGERIGKLVLHFRGSK